MSENTPSTESTESQEIRDVKSFGINRAFVQRAAAVGLFAILGTFAVFQSLPGGKKNETAANVAAGAEGQTGPDAAAAAALAGQTEAESSDKTVNVSKIVASQTSTDGTTAGRNDAGSSELNPLANAKTQANSPPQLSDGAFKPAAAPPVNPLGNFGDAAGRAGGGAKDTLAEPNKDKLPGGVATSERSSQPPAPQTFPANASSGGNKAEQSMPSRSPSIASGQPPGGSNGTNLEIDPAKGAPGNLGGANPKPLVSSGSGTNNNLGGNNFAANNASGNGSLGSLPGTSGNGTGSPANAAGDFGNGNRVAPPATNPAGAFGSTGVNGLAGNGTPPVTTLGQSSTNATEQPPSANSNLANSLPPSSARTPPNSAVPAPNTNPAAREFGATAPPVANSASSSAGQTEGAFGNLPNSSGAKPLVSPGNQPVASSQNSSGLPVANVQNPGNFQNSGNSILNGGGTTPASPNASNASAGGTAFPASTPATNNQNFSTGGTGASPLGNTQSNGGFDGTPQINVTPKTSPPALGVGNQPNSAGNTGASNSIPAAPSANGNNFGGLPNQTPQNNANGASGAMPVINTNPGGGAAGNFAGTTPPTTANPSGLANRNQLASAPSQGMMPKRSEGAVGTLPTPGDRQLEGVQVPTIAIEKVAPPEIQVNQVAAFSIIVRNTGRVPADGVMVHDQVPANTQFVNATPAPADGASTSHLVWELGTLKPGEEKSIQVNLRPIKAGEIGSVAQVTFATRAAVRSTVTEPILAIEHSGPLQSLLGQNVMLDITVQNKGTGVARDVMIQETVPPQLKYSDNYNELEYIVGTLGPGQSKRVQLTLQAAQVGQFRNLVQAVGTGVAAAKHEIQMEVIAPKLQVTSEGPRSRFLKRDATHRFQVANQGTAAATNVDLIAKLPRGIKFVAANNQGQYDPRSHAVYWSLPELKPAQTASVQLDTLPIETGPQDIEFQAVADLQQKEVLTHSLAVEHLVDVYFEIDDMDDHIEVGSETRYQLRIVNQGTKPATNIRLAVEFANGVRPTNSAGAAAGQIQGQRVIFTPIANLNPGEEATLEITGLGAAPGEHRVAANLQTDGREINITKEESTRVYADR